jgi:N-acetylmuramoyl-L-alanine amidase
MMGSRPVPRTPVPGFRTGLVLLGVSALAILAAAPASRRAASRPAPELARIRYWTGPDNTRIVFDLTGPPPVAPRFRLADSLTYEVYLPQMRKSTVVTTEFVGDSLVADIFPAVSDSGAAVRIHLKQPVTPLNFILRASDGNPDRVVIDVPAPPNPEAERALAEQVSELKRSSRMIIAVDAGHGGEDPGAIGYHRLQEADVTLAIAKKLKVELEQIPGVTAFLTRTGDYFIPLRQRIDIARRYQADVMISIHCNASRDRGATGTEVYFLSLTGATDEAARSLAEKENAADLVGGAGAGAGDDLMSILFDLRQNDTIRRSSELAEQVIDALGEDNRLTTRGVKQAGFVVLKAPEIPSVLVETAFITNPREAAMLKDGHFQAKVAELVATGVQGYRSQHHRVTTN